MLATATSPKTERIPALDFTKGALVLFMVLYHWINYFIGIGWPHYRYLRFLSPSFIFISGFMVSSVYLSKYEVIDFRLPKRLIVRGLKLLAIFIGLNGARLVVLPILSPGVSLSYQLDSDSVMAAFVTGNFTNKIVSFSILVPIAYLLILSGLLMFLYRRHRSIFHVVFVLFLVSAVMLDMLGAKTMNLEIVTIGMLGVLIGFRPSETIQRIARYPYLLGFAYVLYIVAISIWNVPFLLEIVGVCLSVTMIYLVGSIGTAPGRLQNVVILLGKYSLLGYISQIAILQILAASLRRFNPGIPVLAGSFIAAFALTIISVEIVDRARREARSVDRVYRVVFN
ncbi:MAG: hypothetical protein WA354_19910 [Terracidiphilus sp.]